MVSNRVRVGVVAAVVTELLYGCSYVFTKDVTNTISPVTLLAWRFWVAFAALLVLWAFRIVHLNVSRASLGPLLLLAAFQPVAYYVGETFGVERTTASESGLILSAIPVASLLTAVVVLGARPSRRQVVGISVTLAGVAATVLSSGLSLDADAVGYLLLLLAVVSFALYTVFAERYARASDTDKTFVMVAAGATVFGAMAITQHAKDRTLGGFLALPTENADFAIAIAYLALGSTIAGFFLQNFAIGTLGSTRYSTFIGVSTVAALITGALVLDERLSAGQLLGGAMILAGVYLANRRIAGQPTPPANQPSP